MDRTREHKHNENLILIEMDMNGIGFSIMGLVIRKDKIEYLQSQLLKKQMELMT